MKSFEYKLRIPKAKEISKMEFLTYVENFDGLCVIVAKNSRDRKQIHNYLETNHPSISKISLRTNTYDSNIKMRFMKCGVCGYKKVKLDEYMERGFDGDEYFHGNCSKCHYTSRLESDDQLTIIKENNIVVTGQYLEDYEQHPYAGRVKEDSFPEKCDLIYTIANPNRIIGKGALQSYIDASLGLS